jgi:hypothetical protein
VDNPEYQKYVYWLEGAELEALHRGLTTAGIHMVAAKKAVCTPLSKRVQIGYVPPDAWESFELCKRQLSWQRFSKHHGKTLVVSSFDLKEHGLRCETVIRPRSFRPPALPTGKEKLELVRTPSYLKARPAEWEDLASRDVKEQERWMKVMGLRTATYKELFLSHCANHANFIEPAYFVVEQGERTPYSIGKTSHICSACLEFYNIIGGGWKRKLVVPCPGAVIFAGMGANRYYEVAQP